MVRWIWIAISEFHSALSSLLTRSRASKFAFVSAVGATFDALTVLSIVSMVFTLRYAELMLVAALHLAFSTVRALVKVSLVAFSLVQPHWVTSRRLFAIYTYSAILSAALFLGFSLGALLMDSAVSMPAFTEKHVDTEVLALALYCMANAIISFFMWSRKSDDPPGIISHVSTSVPRLLLTLKDITSRTLVLDDVGAADDHAVDGSDRELCCICLCSMLPGEVVSDLTCNHRYHKSCLEGWEASQRRHRRPILCPMRCETRSVRPFKLGHVHAKQRRASFMIML
eukprot:TRINITY_DN11447_c0_g10_i1.p1 TRINITY_DN11447_c0_g10~~TRINITY_DN11447_c0_g10_i1.p1  ORF type:complete len:307 (+),score=16.11 TRINITY_DN11447_c0_g10_i1:71-922(+)